MKDLHQHLLAGAIDPAGGDEYIADLGLRVNAGTSPEPVIVLTGDAADGRRIRVYEGVALGPTDDAPLRRGFIWIAVVDDDVRTYPSRRNSDGTVVPGRIIGPYLAISTRSAQDALDRGRVKLAHGC